MIAKALVTLGDPFGDGVRGMFYATIRCSECDFTAWSSVRTDVVTAEEYATNSIRDHLETHEPGRAPDIEVDYILTADCSVCEDGGDVKDEGEALVCGDCGTTWYRDGTYGERNSE